jgi:hypothetical protein
MGRSTNPREELIAARRAVEEAARHVRAIRRYATASRLADRLEVDEGVGGGYQPLGGRPGGSGGAGRRRIRP